MKIDQNSSISAKKVNL